MRAGTQQDERLSPALLPGYFCPDEWPLALRLRLALLQAGQLAFADGRGHLGGSWAEALAQDSSFILAEIAAFQIERLEARVLADFAWIAPAQQWQHCLGLIQQINRWCHSLQTQAPELALNQAMQLRISVDLGPLLAAALAHAELQQAPGSEAESALLALHPSWQRNWPAISKPPTSARGSASSAQRDLRQLWLGLCRALRQFARLAETALPASLCSGRHEPAMGLLLAHLQLIQRSRAPLNRFGERLTDFYYRERLGFALRPAEPDRVHLILSRDPRFAKPVEITPDTLFVAAKNAAGQAPLYQAEQALELSNLHVARLLTLRLESSPMISPELEFGYATRAVATDIPLPSPSDAAQPRAPSWPVLGGAKGPGAVDARQGLAIASPLLALSEGQRDIEVRLRLCHPAQSEGGLAALLARCHACEQAPELYQALGRLLAAWLCDTGMTLAGADLSELQAHVRKVLAQSARAEVDVDDPLSLLFPLRTRAAGAPGDSAETPSGASAPAPAPQRELIFERLLRGMWQAQVSVPEGWLRIDDEFFVGLQPAEHKKPDGDAEAKTARPQQPPGTGQICFTLSLRPDQPPLCACVPEQHGADWPALPVLQLRLQNQSRMFGASLMQQLQLELVDLQVQASDLRNLQLHNQLGRLDPSKPFQPFGPLPKHSDYLVFSHRELLSKPLDSLTLSLHWSGLPSVGNRLDLAAHYQGYPDGPWDAERFRCQLSVLSGGRWREALSPPQALFGNTSNAIPANSSGNAAKADFASAQLGLSKADLLRLHRPHPLASGQEFVYKLASQQGFFRLRLAEPPHAFGHALYPRLLTEVLSQNARAKLGRGLQPTALPAEPYTPCLDGFSLSYRAAETIKPAASNSELIHLTPFGMSPLRLGLGGGKGGSPVLQRWAHAGQLLIGLAAPTMEGAAPEASGVLSLLFQLQATAAQDSPGELTAPRQFSWAAWCSEGWRELEPHRVLLDSTLGLLRTGLVMLDLPGGLSQGCPDLPPGLFWLRLGADSQLDRLAPLQGLWAQAISARRVVPAQDGLAAAASADKPSRADDTCLPPGSIKASLAPLPGLQSTQQPLASFGARPAEDLSQLRTRAAERLRHRSRASTPWDFERLVLQAFPEVFKLRCQPQGQAGAGAEAAGSIVVTVVPAAIVNLGGAAEDGTEARRLDAATLTRIQQFLAQRCAPGARIIVRNASYERIQVRCALRLKRGVQAGDRLRQLNQILRDYLSPWRPSGITARFDWSLRSDEVEAHLRAQDAVDTVGQVSLLQIVRDDGGRYQLRDTAAQGANQVVRPFRDCSLALPTRGHQLDLEPEPGRRGPQVSGLSRLSLGGSFIIGRAGA